MTIHETIGSELQAFGGQLECTSCGAVRPLGSVSAKLQAGWPKCCGYTMRWVTARQLAERAAADNGDNR